MYLWRSLNHTLHIYTYAATVQSKVLCLATTRTLHAFYDITYVCTVSGVSHSLADGIQCIGMNGVLLPGEHMNAIFTPKHMHTHNQLPYGNVSVKQRTARPVIGLTQCCHCGM